MFTANLSGASVGAPGSVTINLAASDAAALPAVPTLSWWGRIFLTLMSALAGLYVMVRNRFSALLIGMLVVGLVAAPPLTAAQTRQAQKTDASKSKKEDKGGKFKGTVQSVDGSGSNLVLTLAGGGILTFSKTVVNIMDARAGHAKPGTVQQLVAGSQVVVKVRTDAQGNVTHVKIKIKG